MPEIPLTYAAKTPLAQLRQQLQAEEAAKAIHGNKALVSSGYQLLDQSLPQQGWQAGVMELLLAEPAWAELSLMLPSMALMQQQGRHIAFINPPAIPYAPALQQAGLDLSGLLLLPVPESNDAAWAAEQLLQSGQCGLLMAWFQPRRPQTIRRLQLLAKAQQSLLVLVRPLSALAQSSPALARLELKPVAGGAELLIHKWQGALSRPNLTLRWPEYGA